MPDTNSNFSLVSTGTEINRLVTAAFAPATQAAYQLGIRLFEEFRASHGLPLEWPAPSHHLLHFAAHLSLQGKAHSTLRTYLAGIGAKHKLNGWADPTDCWLLKKLLQGLLKTDKRTDQRFPVTLSRLQQLIGVLPSICTNAFEAQLLSTAFTLAFFGFFRISELLGQGHRRRDVGQGLLYSDCDVSSSDHINIFLASSKTDQRGKGTQVAIQQVKKFPSLCPVHHLRNYVAIRPRVRGPLLVHFNGSPLTRFQFQAVLKKAASALGWEVGHYSSHSFRIGAATTAALNGTPLESIMRRGRWKSSAVRGYIRTQRS